MINIKLPPVTLATYVGRNFFMSVIGMLGGLSGLVSLFDFLELLRESANRPNAGFGVVVEIEILRLPWIMMQILPFAILLGGVYAFWRLTRSSELVVARAAGISAWQFLAAPVLLATLMGLFAITALSPVSAAMYSRAEALFGIYIQGGQGPLSLAGGELWLREADDGLGRNGIAILHGSGVILKGKVLRTAHMTILRLNSRTELLQRIESPSAVLGADSWHLADVHILQPGAAMVSEANMNFPTDLTVRRVQESFASPNALSFWSLPGFIAVLKRSGFSPIRHELQFQSLLALPLLCATMALVAAGFSMRPARRGGVGQALAGGVSSGFVLFMVSQVAGQFGKSGALPVGLAAWAPAAAGMMLALALLLHLEDG